MLFEAGLPSYIIVASGRELRPNAGSMPCADKHNVERPVFEDSLERPISLADGDCSGLVIAINRNR